ncbi:hypothetical protein I5G81_gp56 [Mycobacterium phage Shandong1]|uniref:Uncharacterized protein n=1 Tax=Mycobacterium phage Shandong1 TaxID=1983447 RepID=A0A1X9SH82_9CAUD|nr:hypothetical protein I5G81_gp56 [Mycobacterium phage Shandong1]ARQ95495.1 hypothetical protein [Mycobacterium phage Shandong1]
MTDRPLCEVCGRYEARVFDPSGAMWCRVCDLMGLGELAVREREADSNPAGMAPTSANGEASNVPEWIQRMQADDDQAAEVDMVNQPSHYNQGPPCKGCGRPIECLDITEHMNFCLGNTVKYVWRCDLKHDAIEDLRKARVYLDREIARREAQLVAEWKNRNTQQDKERNA